MQILDPLRRLVAPCVALVVAASAVAAAQTPSLAEVARKEQDRRKTTKPATKVLTNKDLPTVTSPAPLPPPVEAAPAPAAADAAPKPEEPQKDEAWWRARITAPREALNRNQVLLDALQSRVNALSNDFAARDDPYQRSRIGADRQKALAEIERVLAEVESLKKQIDDIEEEARRAGVPPGWLR